jgi:hypothetical protein
VWSFRDPLRNGEICPALFVEGDLFHPIFPAFSPSKFRSSFFSLVQMLQLSLFHVILGPEDLAVAYGLDSTAIQTPVDPSVALPPDEEWLELLAQPCRGQNL